MKRIKSLVFLLLLFLMYANAQTTCEVRGSSNNNTAILNTTTSNASRGNGSECCVQTSVSLTNPSLGQTTVIVAVYDEDGRQIANKGVVIEKNQQNTGRILICVEKTGSCNGVYTLRLKEASCNEQKAQMKKLKGSSDYIDLGLPSGTKWKNSNETSLYTMPHAEYVYGSALPSKEQWDELVEYCDWEWKNVGEYKGGAQVTGPNGNTIFLPAAGYSNFYSNNEAYKYSGADAGWVIGEYCTSTVSPAGKEYYLYFSQETVKVQEYHSLVGEYNVRRSVRLVAEKTPVQSYFVDLGLPSGTKWKNTSETERYTYDEAMAKFGDQMPTKTQWSELKELCEWIDHKIYIEVIGPNKNSIIIKKGWGYSKTKALDDWNDAFWGGEGFYLFKKDNIDNTFRWRNLPKYDFWAAPIGSCLSVHLVNK